MGLLGFKKKRKRPPSPPTGQDNKMSKALGSRWSVQCGKLPGANDWALNGPVLGFMDRSWMPSAIRVLSSRAKEGRWRTRWAEGH